MGAITASSKIKKHKKILTDFLQEIANERNHALGNDMEFQAITDHIHHHYQLVRLGWAKDNFLFNVFMHFDINPNTGKIWIQQNNTESLVGQELVHRGVSAQDIVLGFKPEYIRPNTGYAMA